MPFFSTFPYSVLYNCPSFHNYPKVKIKWKDIKLTYKEALYDNLGLKLPSKPAKNNIITKEVAPNYQGQMAEGIKIEHEHKPTYDFIAKYLEDNKKLPPEEEVYKHIAQDHMTDTGHDPLYYTHLVEMLKKYSKETDY
jgi:hypothetical protein